MAGLFQVTRPEQVFLFPNPSLLHNFWLWPLYFPNVCFPGHSYVELHIIALSS